MGGGRWAFVLLALRHVTGKSNQTGDRGCDKQQKSSSEHPVAETVLSSVTCRGGSQTFRVGRDFSIVEDRRKPSRGYGRDIGEIIFGGC